MKRAATTLLQNFPIPSDNVVDTLTQDYDQGRFFIPSAITVSGSGRAIKAPFLGRLYELLKNELNEISQQEEYPPIIRNMPTEDISERLIQSIKCWVFVSEEEYTKTPLQFMAFNSHLSLEIIRFCLKHEIIQYLQVAIDLIEKCFSKIKDFHIQQEQDPETGEEWILLNFTIEGEVDNFLKSYDDYTNHWITSAPWPERDKIRLSYNII